MPRRMYCSGIVLIEMDGDVVQPRLNATLRYTRCDCYTITGVRAVRERCLAMSALAWSPQSVRPELVCASSAMYQARSAIGIYRGADATEVGVGATIECDRVR